MSLIRFIKMTFPFMMIGFAVAAGMENDAVLCLLAAIVGVGTLYFFRREIEDVRVAAELPDKIMDATKKPEEIKSA
jgi:hypothetical protein